MRCFTAIVIALTATDIATAGGPCSGVRGGCGRSSYRASDSLPRFTTPEPTDDASTDKLANSGCGTVYVGGYTRKDGTHVSGHTRRKPGCAGSSPAPRYRTSARTSPRTTYWKGPGSEPDDESHFAPAPSERPELPARYIVYFLNGKTRKVADYQDHGDTFSIGATKGFTTNYPRWMIDRIEPIAEANDSSLEPAPVYIVHYKSGKTESLIDFYAEDAAWVLFFVGGGRAKLPESMIDYFEPTRDAIGVMRRWTDSAGSHHVTAKFVGINGEKVTLTKDDGSTIQLTVGKLSEADQDLARRLQELIK